MLQNYSHLFPDFPDNSKVWMYFSDCTLDDNQVVYAKEKIVNFTENNWASHGEKIFASASIQINSIIIIVADENKQNASGCSIDSSVHIIKELGKEFNVDFFNRLYVFITDGNEQKRIHMSDLKSYEGWEIFDPMISNLGELRSKWLKPVSAHPLFSI